MKNMVSFWSHLSNSRSPILKAALQTNADLSLVKNVNSWYTYLKRILKFLDMEHILYTTDLREINMQIRNIKRILHQKTEANSLATHNKTRNLDRTELDLFCKIKSIHFGAVVLSIRSPEF